MRHIVVLITLVNRSRVVMSGLFPTEWAAIDMAHEIYEEEGVLSAVPRAQEVC
jgi:hypothetical protein